MEIPYIVTPRKDTGLFNAKIAIWLFLASEVMLFGGFFSAYIFLRLGADYPWPERTLPVLPGLINTFVLIGSSVTVVFAWASLKMRKWRMFQLYMGITVACAVLFMILKGVEYSVKFDHQAVRLKDYTIVEGHLGYKLKEGADAHHPKADDYETDHHGKKIEENQISVKAGKLTFNTVRYYKPWVEELISQAEHHGSKIVLAADVKSGEKSADKGTVYAKAGEPLTPDLLAKLQRAHLAARANNSGLRKDAFELAWKEKKTANPGKRGWQLAPDVKIDEEALAPKMLTEIGTVSFDVVPHARMNFKPRDIKPGETQSRLRDDTLVDGKLEESPMGFHYVDAIDFRYLAMKAVEKGQDPVLAIDNCWLVKNEKFAYDAWEWNKAQMVILEKKLAPHGKEPTAKERYRIGWKDFVSKAEGTDRSEDMKTIKEEFTGPDYTGREAKKTFPEHFELPREQVAFASKFTPSWNTYYAIYFTITGLHGLHVIGGALVLAYYLFFGRKMYETNPEWLTNRVEIGGLFWHFVDLVWIFAFPIFYLM